MGARPVRRAAGTPEEGFATPVVVLALAIVVLGIAGVSIDLWRVMAAHGRLADLTDASAVAGTGAVDLEQLYATDSIDVPLDVSGATAMACDYLAVHADLAVCPGPDVRVEVAGSEVTVTTRSRVALGLVRLLFALGEGPTHVEISATATAAALRRAAVP